MRQQNLTIVLVLALCLMSTALAEGVSNTTNNETGVNSTLLDNGDNNVANVSANETIDSDTDIAGVELSADDEYEVNAIAYPYGAKVRLLELEKGITRNLLIGTKVVSVLNAANSTANLTKLESILDEMENLLQEVKNTSLEGNKIDLAKKYVDLKREAISLSKQFRDGAKPYINPSARQELAVTINLVDTAAVRNLSEEIKLTKCEFNAQRLETILTDINATNPGLVEKVKACNATLRDIEYGISVAFRNLTSYERKILSDKARENRIKGNIVKKEILADIKANLTQRHLERQQLVMNKIQNRSITMNRTQFVQSVNERIARISDMEDRMGQQHRLRPIGTVIMPGGPRR
jgi:hypothetical protein